MNRCIILIFVLLPLSLKFSCQQKSAKAKTNLVVLKETSLPAENVLVENASLRIPKDAKYGGTLRLSMATPLFAFNWLNHQPNLRQIQSLVHNRFTQNDPNSPESYSPELVHKVELSADKKVYTLHFRDDVFWQRPPVDFSKPENAWLEQRRKLTADDAAFYFERIQNQAPNGLGPKQKRYENLEKVEVVDDFTLKVYWKQVSYDAKSATLDGFPIPRWLYTKKRDGSWLEDADAFSTNHWAFAYAIGTGPYEVTKSIAGKKLILKRSENYWGTKYPIKKIEYQFSATLEESYKKFMAGEIDFIQEISLEDYKRDFKDQEAPAFKEGLLRYQVVKPKKSIFLAWNQHGHFFSDKRVRRAMTYAMDRQSFLDDVQSGLGELSTSPFSNDHPAIDPSIEPLPFDHEKAKNLLAEAGWIDSDADGVRDQIIEGKKVDFKFRALGFLGAENMKKIKETLLRLGVGVEIVQLSMFTIGEIVEGENFHAAFGNQSISRKIHSALWASSLPFFGGELGSLKTDESDKILEELTAEFSPQKRLALARQLHPILHEEQPRTYLYAPKSVAVWRKGLKNVKLGENPRAIPFTWYFEESIESKSK